MLSPALQELRGTETVLVVDDVDLFRDVVVRLLQVLGYRVLPAVSGAEALELLSAHPEVALVLTDVRMPGMSGRELQRRIADRGPSCEVLYMTGFGGDHLEGCDPDAVLAKPFSHLMLARRVRDRLDR